MIEIVMQNSHHGNHEPALAARIEKTEVGILENEVSYESRIYILAAPVRRIRWPPPERAARKQSSGGCGQTIQFPCLPFPPFDDPTSSKLIHERLEWHPTQLGVISDLDQPGYFKTRKL
jgi:hypothetical protein